MIGQRAERFRIKRNYTNEIRAMKHTDDKTTNESPIDTIPLPADAPGPLSFVAKDSGREGSSTLQQALNMAARGLPVFPVVENGKEPACRSWKEVATTDPDKIKAFFEDNPDINYAISVPEGFVVVDIDVSGDKKGKESLDALEADIGDSSAISNGSTFTVRTQSGGIHYYLRIGEVVGNGHSFGKDAGIDIRGNKGAYVLGPGSSINGSSYTIDHDVDFMDCPEWVSTRLRRVRKDSNIKEVEGIVYDTDEILRRARKFIKDRDVAIEGQNGNNHLYATFCYLHDLGVSREKAVELLGDWNELCQPAFSDEEMRVISNNAYEYSQSPAGSKISALERMIPTKPRGAESLDDCVPDVGVDIEEESAVNKWDGLAQFGFGDVFKEYEPPKFVIRKWLPKGGITGVLAETNKGKTINLVNLAMTLATGKGEWLGQPCYKKNHVVYFAGEGINSVKAHLKAWQYYNEINKEGEGCSFVLFPDIVQLNNADDVRKVTDWLKRHYEGKDNLTLIYDTWQMATSEISQMEDKDIQRNLRTVREIAEPFEATTVAAFHTPKDGSHTVYGSSLITNMLDMLWMLSAKGDSMSGEAEDNPLLVPFSKYDRTEVTLKQEKNRPGVLQTELKYRHKVIPMIGVRDEYDDQATGAVVYQTLFQREGRTDAPEPKKPNHTQDEIDTHRLHQRKTLFGIITQVLENEEGDSINLTELCNVINKSKPDDLTDGSKYGLYDLTNKCFHFFKGYKEFKGERMKVPANRDITDIIQYYIDTEADCLDSGSASDSRKVMMEKKGHNSRVFTIV